MPRASAPVQLAGVVCRSVLGLLGFGIWLAADYSSIVTLLKFADHSAIRVSI